MFRFLNPIAAFEEAERQHEESMNLKIRPEMAQHPLAQAARETNAHAEKYGLRETCERYGLELDDVRYMAEQRALRCIYAYRGINLNLQEVTVLQLTPSEQLLFVKLAAANMDALVIGWVAYMKKMKNDESENETETI